ncbi:MAG: winged helix DNA-binding protein [Dehalococcoidia bacterium]|nr:winged helix DNA-binding protein [Dehalococcoidia bacterium]
MEHPLDRWFFIIHRCRHAFMRVRLGGRDVEPRLLPFLYHIQRVDGLRQEDLSLEMGLDKTTVAHAVKRLVGLGYVSRMIDPEDRRCYRLSLTENGISLYNKLGEVFRDWNKGLFSGFTEEELQIQEGFFRRMAENAKNLAQQEASDARP